MTRKKPQQGSPQQRRFLGRLAWSPSWKSTAGQEDGRELRVFCAVGVDMPGGGKAASIPESPDRRFSTGDAVVVRKMRRDAMRW
jgi:hypothetical protein